MQPEVAETQADISDTDMETDGEEIVSEELSEDSDSVGSLADFLQEDIVVVPKDGNGGVDPANILQGKRNRRPTQKYVPRNYAELMLDDVPADEAAAALGQGITSSEDSPEDEEDDSDVGTLDVESDDGSDSSSDDFDAVGESEEDEEDEEEEEEEQEQGNDADGGEEDL